MKVNRVIPKRGENALSNDPGLPGLVEISLSRRNLENLLRRLDEKRDGPRQSIWESGTAQMRDDVSANYRIIVFAEENERHYASRDALLGTVNGKLPE